MTTVCIDIRTYGVLTAEVLTAEVLAAEGVPPAPDRLAGKKW
jgi:hypothetical protein